MRSGPKSLWRGNDRVCWVCLLMEVFIGSDTLQYAPEVLAGFDSVAQAPALRQARRALFNFRQIMMAYSTEASVRQGVERYLEHHRNAGTRGVYEIDARTLHFKRVDFFEDGSLAQARKLLQGVLPYAPVERQMADPAKEMSAVLGDGPYAPRIPILPITAPLPARRVHDLSRTPAGRNRGANRRFNRDRQGDGSPRES